MIPWRRSSVSAVVAILVGHPAFAGLHFTAEQARQLAIAMPKPVYPEFERQHGISGSGLFKLYVRVETGRVTRITVLRSTGNVALDNAATKAFRQWRFKPGSLPSMRQLYPASKEANADVDACLGIPISFVLTPTGARVQ